MPRNLYRHSCMYGSEKTRAQLKVVILRSWLAACKSAGNFDISGLSEVDVIACFRSALQNPDKAAKNRLPPSRNDALNMKQFSLMLLLLSARRLGRSEQGHDPTNCPVEWVEAVADMLMAIGFVSNSNAQEQSSATSSPPTLRSNDRDSNFRSPNASYLRGTMCRNSLDAPIQPHQLLTRSCSRSALQSRDGTLSQLQHRNESSKPMKFLWQPQMFSSNADVFASPGTYELPSYMRRDWELHRLRKSKSGKISMLVGLPPSRGRTARTFSDIKHIGQPQEEYEAALKSAQTSRTLTPFDGAGFIAGASVKSDNVRLMSLKRFLYADLTARLRKEWPSSFATVSEDCRGFVVAEFHFNRAAIEGDVLSYMTKYNKLDDGVLTKFKLKRDVKTWGRVMDERVLFAWRPPWVKASLVELYFNCEDDPAEQGSAGGSSTPTCLQKLKPERESLLFTERSKSFGLVRRSPIGLPFRGPLLTCALGFD